MKYIKDFLIGASFILWPHKSLWKYTDNIDRPTWLKSPDKIVGTYTIKRYNYWKTIMSLWFGSWNVISRIIAEKYGLSKHVRFLVILLVSLLCQLILVCTLKVYELTTDEWIQYSSSRLIAYLFVWFAIYNLDKYI